MTLNEMAYNILNLLRGNRTNHDEYLSIPQIKFNILHYRAVFIRRDYAKNGFNSRHVEQDLGCLELVMVDSSGCEVRGGVSDADAKRSGKTPCQDVPQTGCKVYRTKAKIPKTIRYNFEEAITYVGDITGRGTIPFINNNMIQFLGYDKYTNDKMKSYMINDYIYIHNANGLKWINARGVFENPEELSNFTDCTTGSICYDDSSTDYPIPYDMVSQITQGFLNGELKLLAGTYSDIENDRIPDPQTVVRQGGGKQ